MAIKDDLLIAVDYSGLAHCLDALTGKRYWFEYEIDKDLVQRSRAAVTRFSLDKLIRIEQRDIATVDLRDFDVVAVYLVPNQLQSLIPRLEKLKPGARTVSHQFQIPGIAPDQTITVDSNDDGQDHTIHLWTAPLPSQ